MAGEWSKKTFADLVGGPRNIIGGPFGSNLTQADYKSSGVPIIRGSNMQKAGRYIGGEFAFVSADKANQLQSNQVSSGDIVVTQRGTMGQISIIPPGSYDQYVVSQSQMGVKVRGSDPLFVYYLLRSPLFLDFLDGATIQTGVPHINMGILRNWEINAPDPSEQRNIASVLSALDDKIELNSQIALTLQEAIQTLFESWFVNFDPVMAKIEGRELSIPADLAKLFSDNLQGDGLPEGWSLDSVGSMFDVVGGNTPSTTESIYWNGKHPWATPKDMSSLSLPVITGTNRLLTDEGLEVTSSKLVPCGSLLLSSRAPIGYLAFCGMPTAINQGIAAFVQKDVSVAYAWGWCVANMDAIKAAANGSTFQEISKGTLRKLSMLRPPDIIIKAFDQSVAGMLDKLIAIASENQTIAELRDSLLPKLILGELRVIDAAMESAAA